MYSPFKLAVKYLRYCLTAANGRGHGIHSPFVFEFIRNVLNDRKEYPAYLTVEDRRKELLREKRLIAVEDHGAGSAVLKKKERRIADIAASSLKPPKYGKLLYRIAKYYKAKTALELGTSFGVTSAYLSYGSGELHTIEGAPMIAMEAKEFFTRSGLENVGLYTGTFNKMLLPVLQKLEKVDLVFVDGNHRYTPTVEYFEQIKQFSHDDSILIFDDIHWSGEMEQAWEFIKNHSSVTLTIDLFFIGLVFFKKDFKHRQHFTIRF